MVPVQACFHLLDLWMAGKVPGATKETKPKTKLQKALSMLHLNWRVVLVGILFSVGGTKAYSEATVRSAVVKCESDVPNSRCGGW